MKKYQDDQVRHRAARRSERLYTKMHSVDFDIITGQPKLAHQVPQVPPPPQVIFAPVSIQEVKSPYKK